MLHCYAANGAAVVEEITVGLPTPFPAVSLLVELLISQMLLPAPPLLVFAYQSLLVRLVESVGQALAMCARVADCHALAACRAGPAPERSGAKRGLRRMLLPGVCAVHLSVHVCCFAVVLA